MVAFQYIWKTWKTWAKINPRAVDTRALAIVASHDIAPLLAHISVGPFLASSSGSYELQRVSKPIFLAATQVFCISGSRLTASLRKVALRAGLSSTAAFAF